MKKFIRYLYEYQNERQVQNVGFVRVEESEDFAVIQIYGKGFPATAGQALEIFLFYSSDGKCVGIPVGGTEGMRPASGYRLEIHAEDVGGREIFQRLNGVILKSRGNGRLRWWAAVWDDRPVNIEQMIIQEEPREHLEDIKEKNEESNLLEKSEVEMKEPEEELEMEGSEMEEPEMEEEKEESKEEENPEQVYKITRQDLVKLPRREWNLANNHFLMHGYRNFHHLVSFAKDGKSWLGVPGIYHPQEQRAASAFGFEDFMRPEDGEITLTEEEQSTQGEFGYWCRVVSRVIRE